MLNKKTKGYTLIEIILVLSIISLISAGIYIQYVKKFTASKVKEQISYIENISDALQEIYITNNNYSTLSTANGVIWGAVPDKLKNGTEINNVFGGKIMLNPSPTLIDGNSAYSIILDRIPTNACIGLATSDYGQTIPEVYINNNSVKTSGTHFNANNIISLTLACQNNNNIVEFRGSIPLLSSATSPSSTPIINKVDPFYIPTVGSAVTSPAPSCTGGATWTGSFCSCSNGQVWVGTVCEAVDSTFRSCQFGKSWSMTTKSCEITPATKANTMHYSSSSPTVAPILVPGSAIAPTPVYVAGRYLPSEPKTIETTPININVQVSNAEQGAEICSSLGGNWDGLKCNVCPSPLEIVKNKDGQTLTIMPIPHSVKSSWNGYRCVTPNSGW